MLAPQAVVERRRKGALDVTRSQEFCDQRRPDFFVQFEIDRRADFRPRTQLKKRVTGQVTVLEI